ncbi:TetR/AcrR family transcriptional regulator [Bradyrhizobium sp. DASA03007]|uniref:TetR/AcrR family transcriptional regulator n=1 Tax=unclassified Bradyrhizobium TaxID=2631580 RepID=UPI003F722946
MKSKAKSKTQRSSKRAISREKEQAHDVYRIRGAHADNAETLGLREQNKVDKFQRIYAAARRQFAEVGYDGTTLRDIAKEARVALGTLGFYAENKRELVLLIFNEFMAPVIDRCREAGVYQGSLVDAVVAHFRPVYSAYAAEPDLFRTILRENVFHTTSPHAREFSRIRLETISHLRDLVSKARDAGEIMPYIDVDLAARTIFYLMFASVRWWLHATEKPSVEPGLAELRTMTALLLDGMKGSKAEVAPATRRGPVRNRT